MKTENVQETIKIAYKGFDKDLKCRDEQFKVGETYAKPFKKNPKTCTSDGWHYCNDLLNVFKHYTNSGGNRFCEIEVIGNFTDEKDKSTTTSFRIIRELTQDEVTKVINKSKEVQYEGYLNLEEVKWLQTVNPYMHVGGSTALFLHGIRLKRWGKADSSDIDMVMPFFTIIEGDKDHQIDHKDAKASGNDFDETFILNNVKVDVKIDPKQRYEVIEYNGFKYKVSKLETILEAKIRYALNGQAKHKQDVYEICGKKL